MCAYFIEMGGYYEYHLAERKNLTEEQIKLFEEDVKNGKDVRIENYLKDTQIDYSNNLTKKTSEYSLKLNDYLRDVIGSVFHVFEKLVG